MKALLRDSLKQLRLSGLGETLDVRLQEAKASKLDHAEFLELILADELAIRRERQIARRIKAACFRDQKTLEDFDWEFNESIKRKQIFDLASGDFVRKCRDAILLGTSQTRPPALAIQKTNSKQSELNTNPLADFNAPLTG